jgi:hypothetical protein
MQAIPILNLNPNPTTFKNGEARDARNVIIAKDYKSVRNEPGFESIYVADGTVVGNVATPDGFVLFLKCLNTDKIVHVKDDIKVKEISSSYFNFNVNYPVKGRFNYNIDGDLIITFSEGVDSPNETRVINIDKSNVNLTKTEVEVLDLIPNVEYPTLSASVKFGGSLLGGSYQIAVSYKVDDGVYSNYSPLSKVYHVYGDIKDHVKPGDSVNRNLHITFTNLDTRYNYYKLAFVHKGIDAVELVYETEDIEISESSYKLYNITSLLASSINDVVIPYISYIKDNANVGFRDKYYRANVKTVDYSGVDAKMKIVAENTKIKVNYKTIYDSLNVPTYDIETHFKEGEYYVFYIGALDYKGNIINAYPIFHKTGDTTTGVWGNEEQTFKIHQIPYYPAYLGYKIVPVITCELPTNVDTLLGTTSSIVKSFCLFYGEHNLFNSKVLGQGFAIRDTHVNDFMNNQTYTGQFGSTSKVRFYSFEHLFNKSDITNVSIYNSVPLYGFVNEDLIIEGQTYPTQFIKVFSEIPHEKITAAISDVNFIESDNSVESNIAGDSYHRLQMSATEINKIFKGSATEPANVTESNWDLINNTGVNDTTIVSRNRMAAFDIISNSNYFYDTVYNQKLVMCSGIFPKTYNTPIVLSGDFFYDNVTIRCTTPMPIYRYGTENIDEQSDIYVFKIIVSIALESRFNIRARFDGQNDYQKVFNIKNTSDTEIKDFFNIPYINDNFINTDQGKGYSVNSHNNGYDYYDYYKTLDTKSHFPSRLIRSVVHSPETKGISWRKYMADSYRDLLLSRGPINDLDADQNTLYIQQKYNLSIASVRDELGVSDAGKSYLGSSDVFDRDPYEVLSESNGYIGCANRFSSTMTLYGYVVVDIIKKKMFLIRGISASSLIDENTEIFFSEMLNENANNPYNQNGVSLHYDDVIKSLFITQKGLNPFTIHYNFPRKHWVSFHDYIPDGYIKSFNAQYCLKDNTVYKKYANNKCLFFSNIPAKSSVTYCYNQDVQTHKMILGLVWNTSVKYANIDLYHRTFDRIMLYNDTQCSGYIELNENVDWFDTEHGLYKKDSWFFNAFKDIVINDKLPFIDLDGNLITDNLNSESNWFDESYFISKYLLIKFVYDNYFINLNTGATSETKLNGYVQPEIVADFIDVNAIKSIR